MEKKSAKILDDTLREEYAVSTIPGQPPNLVSIDPDLASLFPDSESVNRAPRLLADTARAATGSKRRR